MELPSVKYYICTLPTVKGTLYLWTHIPNIQETVDLVERLLLWLGVPNGFKVYLWKQDEPRIISATEWPSRRTVNGGWTHQNSNTIYVYREEEWERVLIHETIHALGWDWKIERTAPCWNVQGELAPHVFEAWTELYAEWLYCAWYNIPWKIQQTYQRHQALQILARAPTPWSENTNVFAYYVLKTVLSEHMPFLAILAETPSERFLCDLVSEPLRQLREEAIHIIPEGISLRMTVPPSIKN